MRQILMLMCGVAMISSVVFADDTTETCAGGVGIVMTGAVTGHKYCFRAVGMTWWNAVSWCDAQGRRLVELRDCACGNTISDCAGNKCPDLTGVSSGWWTWVMNSPSNSTSSTLNVNTGKFNNGMNRSTESGALCY
ncbi:MAG: hypothetical protein IKL32_00245 [Alphaproteobacteria bacterium]|nr:hypothetical protein [Alphaproteobacteria bacterium]